MIPAHYLFFDIETLPTDRDEFIAEAVATVKCSASYKKPESIADWWANEGDEAKTKAIRATSFDGGLGRLAAIAWGWGSEPIKGCHTAFDGAHSEAREREIIAGFFAELNAVEKRLGTSPVLIGHYISAFDIRWIWHRALVLGVVPPWWWPVNARPWDTHSLQDTAIMWAGPRDKISLDRLARILGINGKSGFDGSQVADAWEAGEHERIREYCGDDVRIAREIWCRMSGEDAPVEDVEPAIQQSEEIVEVLDKPAIEKAPVVRSGERGMPDFLRQAVEEKRKAA